MAAYAVVAVAYIALSDRILGAFVDDPEQILQLSLVKGVAFVVVTAGLLHLLLGRTVRTVDRAFVAVERAQAARMHQEEGRRRAEAIVESTSDAIVSNTLEGTITSWNPAAERMFGYAAAEIVGHPIQILIPEDRTEEKAMILRRVENGERFQLETIRVRKDGTRLSVATTFSPIWGPDGASAGSTRIVGVSKIVRDISERRTAEAIAEREQRFARSLVEAMPGVLYLYDEQGRFLRWNRQFELVSGRSAEEIARMTPLDFISGAEQELVRGRIAEVFKTGESSVEASFVGKDGTTTPYYFTGKRIAFEGETCLIGVGVDISERKRAERDLRELNESLERKVEERTRDLGAARERAEAADQIKSAFLASMSHELRTPLNSIIGFTGLVLQGLPGPLNEEQARQLGMVQGSARHLLDLINDVLDISKIEAGQLEVRCEPFDLRSTVERVAASVAPLAEKKGLTVRVVAPEAPAPMESDRRRVEQILLNVINNAIKFTDRGGVTVSLDLVDGPPAPVARIEVADTGIGMKEQDLSRLFQPFRQIDTGLHRQHEGTGLGLAISRRLSGLLGGTIEARSVWNQGSTFTVTLPMNRTAP